MSTNVPLQVSIVGVPEAVHSTVAGLADVFGIFGALASINDVMPAEPPFNVNVVGTDDDAAAAAPFRIDARVGEIHHTDIIIVPALMVSTTDWTPGAHGEVVEWLRAMHARGAMLCSTCSGALLLAETGLLAGGEGTTHWAYADVFRRHFPDVRLRLEHLLVASGARGEIIMSGASGSWHDLALHLIAQRVSAAAAQTIAKFMLLEWHAEGQLPYMMFMPNREHGDAVVLTAQDWLEENFQLSSPVEEMTRRCGLPVRTFKRRFQQATGLTPIKYVQQLRIEAAKRRLERARGAIDEIAWDVGYDDAAFFRRLFKRTTGLTPGAYRRRLQAPDWYDASRRAGNGSGSAVDNAGPG